MFIFTFETITRSLQTNRKDEIHLECSEDRVKYISFHVQRIHLVQMQSPLCLLYAVLSMSNACPLIKSRWEWKTIRSVFRPYPPGPPHQLSPLLLFMHPPWLSGYPWTGPRAHQPAEKRAAQALQRQSSRYVQSLSHPLTSVFRRPHKPFSEAETSPHTSYILKQDRFFAMSLAKKYAWIIYCDIHHALWRFSGLHVKLFCDMVCFLDPA